MVYHPDLGGEADAENKILYFHPPATPLAEQVRCVGLSEALTNFANSLAPGTPCESMHTQNRRYVFEQVEPSVWIVLVVQHGSDAPQEGDSQVGEGEEDLQDAHLKAVLQRIYGTLRLFCGALLPVLEGQGAAALRTLIGGFLSRLLELMLSSPAASSASAASADSTAPPRALSHASDVLDAMDGIRFLPVEQRLYLRAQYVVNLVECAHPSVRHCMLLHHDKLVWSGLTHSSTRLLHRYLLQGLLGSSAQGAQGQQPASAQGQANGAAPPPQGSSDVSELPDHLLGLVLAQVHRQARTQASARHAASTHQGSFLCGAADPLQDGRSAVRVPALLTEALNAATGVQEEAWCRLVVFQVGHTSLALLLEEEPAVWSQPLWYQQLAALLAAELQPLSVQLAEQHARLQALDDPHRYIYFNRLNLAVKCSLRGDKGGGARPGAAAGALRLSSSRLNVVLNRMHADLASGDTREIALKTASDGWLVGRLSGAREFYMLFDAKYTNFSEVHQEVLSLCSLHFSNIFLD